MEKIIALLIVGIGLAFAFLLAGQTTINGVFPYVHVAYPIRALFVIATGIVIGLVSTLIKH